MLFGISGYCQYSDGSISAMNSGKDTFANEFCKQNKLQKIALADPIKRTARTLWGFSNEQLWGPSELRNKIDPRYGYSPRVVLQQLGTEVVRTIDKYFWARKCHETYVKVMDGISQAYKLPLAYSPENGILELTYSPMIGGMFVSDIRFDNEFEYLKDRGIKIIRIKRYIDRAPDEEEGKYTHHSSEQELLSKPDSAFDLVITNTGSLDELLNKAREYVS
jgi:hypothetical protein